MLNYSECVPRKAILVEGHPYEVISSHVFQKQKSRPVNNVRVKSLLTGKTIDMVLHQYEKFEEADMGTREVKYLYLNRGEYWFCDPKNPSDRFQLSDTQVGESIKFIKPNTLIEANTFNEDIIGLKLPIKVELKITEAAPAVKGNTSGNALKTVTLETGATVNVPMFINEGDIIRVNTETGDYAERVEKA